MRSTELALRGYDLAHGKKLPLQCKQSFELGGVGVCQDGTFEGVDLVVHIRQHGEEAVDEAVEDAVEQELLTVQDAPVQLLAFPIEWRE
jgi:hypothetical protein